MNEVMWFPEEPSHAYKGLEACIRSGRLPVNSIDTIRERTLDQNSPLWRPHLARSMLVAFQKTPRGKRYRSVVHPNFEILERLLPDVKKFTVEKSLIAGAFPLPDWFVKYVWNNAPIYDETTRTIFEYPERVWKKPLPDFNQRNI